MAYEFCVIADSIDQENALRRRPVGAPPRANPDSQSSGDVSGETKKKNKPKPFAHLLSRTRSVRAESSLQAPKPWTPTRLPELECTDEESMEGALTAPLQHDKDRTFRDMMNTSIPRKPSGDSDNGSFGGSSRENGKNSSFRDGSGAAFLSNLKSSSSKAADGIGKAGKGFLGKFTWGAGGGESDKPSEEENYVCSVINLPLVEQTRLTRISKRLEFSRDKTEFWMPSLPWRCIEWVPACRSMSKEMLTLSTIVI